MIVYDVSLRSDMVLHESAIGFTIWFFDLGSTKTTMISITLKIYIIFFYLWRDWKAKVISSLIDQRRIGIQWYTVSYTVAMKHKYSENKAIYGYRILAVKTLYSKRRKTGVNHRPGLRENTVRIRPLFDYIWE